jgi:hypothetical protein
MEDEVLKKMSSKVKSWTPLETKGLDWTRDIWRGHGQLLNGHHPGRIS